MALKNKKLIFWLGIAAGLALGLSQYFGPSSNAPAGRLVINEVMAANRSGLADENAKPTDWIELHNAGNSSLNLSGWALTDDPASPEKWTFPGVTLPADGYLLVFASGKDQKTAGQPLHTNFRLGRDGEFLGLYNTLADTWVTPGDGPLPPQFTDVSFGRHPDYQDNYVYLAAPTPGQPNDVTVRWAGLVQPVTFSVRRGFYSEPFQLTLHTADAQAAIYYTVDGTPPGPDHGQRYQGPLTISRTATIRAGAVRPDYKPAPVTAHSYIFLADVLAQRGPPPGFPATWGVYREDYRIAKLGQPVPADYEVDPDIVAQSSRSRPITAGLTTLPSLFLTFDPAHFDIYSQPNERGPAWERPVSVEWFDPDAPDSGFQLNAGMRIQGDIGRQEYIAKHSFRLFFRSQYGPTHLTYPLFPTSPVEKFDSLIVRGGVQRSFVSVWPRYRQTTTYLRDEWLRRSQIEMSQLGPHGRFAHLYLNGLYWGLYNIVERPDHDFAAAYFNIEPEQWYAFNHSGLVNGDEAEIRARMTELVAASTPTEQATLAKEYLDAAAFADYVILNWYAGTRDWSHNNWYAGYHHPDGKLYYFVWDGELTWVEGADIGFGTPNPPGYLFPNTVDIFFKALIHDPDFKMLLADRLYYHLFNEGSLSAERSQQRWLALAEAIEPAIVAESARWGDRVQEPPLTYNEWQAAVADVVEQMQGNSQKLIGLARERGYYPAIDPPRLEPHGGLIQPGARLTMTAAAGDIYYTTDGSDPRAPGGAVAATARLYQTPPPLTSAVTLNARARQGETWSALASASFHVQHARYNIRFTEIMYNPPGPDRLEFIELQNFGNRTVDLYGMSLRGVDYTFPVGARLRPGQITVLAHNAAAFAEQYPGVEIGGEFIGHLSNDGEEIVLLDVSGQPVTAVTYRPDANWPVSADGRGDSLVLRHPTADPNQPTSWRASSRLYGSPGAVDDAVP